MKYIYQFALILLVSFAGEIMRRFIPLPVPASIYGLLLMLLLLCLGVIKLHHVERTADFLVEIMPLMFIPGGVGLVTAWADLKSILLPASVITVVSTVVTMAASGKVCEFVMRMGKKKDE